MKQKTFFLISNHSKFIESFGSRTWTRVAGEFLPVQLFKLSQTFTSVATARQIHAHREIVFYFFESSTEKKRKIGLEIPLRALSGISHTGCVSIELLQYSF